MNTEQSEGNLDGMTHVLGKCHCGKTHGAEVFGPNTFPPQIPIEPGEKGEEGVGDRLSEIEARLEAVPCGPWEWFGNTTLHDIYLATKDRGRLLIMGFERWGFGGAKPIFHAREAMTGPISDIANYETTYRADFVGLNNPVAEFIAHSPEDTAYLLAELRKAQARLLLADALSARCIAQAEMYMTCPVCDNWRGGEGAHHEWCPLAAYEKARTEGKEGEGE